MKKQGKILMKRSNKEILNLYFLIEELLDDAVGIWEIHNDKNAKSIPSSFSWIIESLVLVGAQPVYGAPKDSNYDWIKTSEFGQTSKEIAENITSALQSAIKKSPIEVEKLMYGIWFAIPELYEYNSHEYKNLRRNKNGKTLEEIIIQNICKFVNIIYKGDDISQIILRKISLQEIMRAANDKTFIQTPEEMEIYIRKNLYAILQLAEVVKKYQNKWSVDNKWGSSSEIIVENIITQWQQTNKFPDITFSFPQSSK